MLVFISRLRRGVNPLTNPGKDHTSHRLVKMGYTQREAVLILYLVGAALGVIAMYLTQATVAEGYVVGGITFLVGVYFLWKLERVGGLASEAGTEPAAENGGDPSGNGHTRGHTRL